MEKRKNGELNLDDDEDRKGLKRRKCVIKQQVKLLLKTDPSGIPEEACSNKLLIFRPYVQIALSKPVPKKVLHECGLPRSRHP